MGTEGPFDRGDVRVSTVHHVALTEFPAHPECRLSGFNCSPKELPHPVTVDAFGDVPFTQRRLDFRQGTHHGRGLQWGT